VAYGQPSAINRLLILNAEPHPGRGTVRGQAACCLTPLGGPSNGARLLSPTAWHQISIGTMRKLIGFQRRLGHADHRDGELVVRIRAQAWPRGIRR
jgi:hypothetical protein